MGPAATLKKGSHNRFTPSVYILNLRRESHTLLGILKRFVPDMKTLLAPVVFYCLVNERLALFASLYSTAVSCPVFSEERF